MDEIFRLETQLWQIAVRGTVVYLAVGLVLRLLPKRHTGNLVPNDIIAVVIAGSLAADAAKGEASTLTDLVLTFLVVMLWDYLFNLAEFRFPRIRGLTQDSPTLLIHRGELLRHNLRKEMLTEEELAASLRMHGISDMSRVEQAILEVDGQVSVVKKEGDR